MAVEKIDVAREEQKASVPTPIRPSAPTLGAFRDEVERWFDQLRTGFWTRPFDFRPSFGLDAPLATMPAVDVNEKDAAFEITAELPGLDAKNVQVSVQNGILTISGEKTEEKEEKSKNQYVSERRYGSFQRSFQVPEAVHEDKIEASFDKGVLKVSLPKKAEAATTKKIEIKT